MSQVLVDTNAFSRLALGDKQVMDIMVSAEIIHFSVVVLAELLYGFKNGSRFEENQNALNRFLSKKGVMLANIDLQTAELYSDIKSELKKLGKPIPENDIWIAAQTIESKAQLITFDKHFKIIPELDLLFLE